MFHINQSNSVKSYKNIFQTDLLLHKVISLSSQTFQRCKHLHIFYVIETAHQWIQYNIGPSSSNASANGGKIRRLYNIFIKYEGNGMEVYGKCNGVWKANLQ